jgi:hypothetical protein
MRHVFVSLLLAKDDDAAGLAVFLCASHLFSESARLFLLLLAEEARFTLFLLLSNLSHKDASPGPLLLPSKESWPSEQDGDDDEAGLPARLVLFASHLPAASARLGLLRGGELLGRMAAHGGAGSSGSIVHLGGVGSSPGRAACSMARCTRATGIAMDRRRGDAPGLKRPRSGSRGDEVERSGFRS